MRNYFDGGKKDLPAKRSRNLHKNDDERGGEEKNALFVVKPGDNFFCLNPPQGKVYEDCTNRDPDDQFFQGPRFLRSGPHVNSEFGKNILRYPHPKINDFSIS